MRLRSVRLALAKIVAVQTTTTFIYYLKRNTQSAASNTHALKQSIFFLQTCKAQVFALSTTTLSFTSIRAEGCGLQIVCVIWKQTGVHDVTLACFSVIAKLCAFPFLTFLFLFVQRTFPVHVTSIVRQCQAPKSALLCCMEVWTIMYHPYWDTMSPH